jgi:predicted HTH domain antitoxin
MTTMVAQYPEDLLETLHMSREEFESEARFAMAAKLFELGRLTTGQAAQLVPMSRYDFIRRISELGVAAIDWDVAEAEDEFKHA